MLAVKQLECTLNSSLFFPNFVFRGSAISQIFSRTDLTLLPSPAGVGVSLVSSSPPAELMFIFLGDIAAEYRRTPARLSLDGSVRHIQADCQLSDAQAPCVLHVTPGAATDERRHLPAVCFAAQRVPSACDRWRIFEVGWWGGGGEGKGGGLGRSGLNS